MLVVVVIVIFSRRADTFITPSPTDLVSKLTVLRDLFVSWRLTSFIF